MHLLSLKLLRPSIKKEMHLEENESFELLTLGNGHTRSCSVPFKRCDLCNCKVGGCYFKWFRKRCSYKKIMCMSLEMLPLHHVIYVLAKFTVLNSLRPTVKEEMHLHEIVI